MARTYVGDQELEYFATTTARLGWTVLGQILGQILVVLFGKFDTDAEDWSEC